MKSCCNETQCLCQPGQYDATDRSSIQWLKEQNETLKLLYIQLKAEYDKKFSHSNRYYSTRFKVEQRYR